MVCPKCGCENVTVSVEQTSAKSSTKGKGCLFQLGRWMLIICTGGLWYLFGKKAAKTKTKMKSKTVALCQNCAHKWYP